MAMSKLKQIERMVLINKPDKANTKSFKINFSPEMNSYKDVLKVKNLSIGYDRELCKLSFEVERGDKLGIMIILFMMRLTKNFLNLHLMRLELFLGLLNLVGKMSLKKLRIYLVVKRLELVCVRF